MTTDADARGLGEMLKECGWGGMVFPDNGQNALISNLLFSPGSATTSGVTTPGSCKGSGATAAIIINSSYEHLEIELAAGDGDYLALLADVVKAEEETGEAFVSTLRAEFTEYVSQPGFAERSRFEKADAFYEMVVD
jgi:hypothetical protein